MKNYYDYSMTGYFITRTRLTNVNTTTFS